MLVLLTLASGQFLMTLDSSVMNVSIEEVAEDVGTTVTGIQGAITAYTLVMAALMITGAKIGAIIGRKRAFAIGCVIYGCGSLTTSLAQSLPVLLFGWSFLEGVGAALIMPAIVALVAGNFPAERRPAAYGLVAAAGAVAVAVGPLIGGLLHDLLLVALGIRRRGRGRAGDPAPDAPDRGRARREATAARHRRRHALGARPRAPRLRRAPLERVGLDPAQDRRSVMGRAVPDDLADHRRPLRDLALLPLAGPPGVARPGAARADGDAPQQAADRRPDDVLLPVPHPGGVLLRRAALPLGRARPLRDRDRHPAAAALRDAAGGGDRHPEAVPATSRRASSSDSAFSRSSQGPWCCSAGSTPTRARRSSSCRCCSSGSGSARSRRSSGP